MEGFGGRYGRNKEYPYTPTPRRAASSRQVTLNISIFRPGKSAGVAINMEIHLEYLELYAMKYFGIFGVFNKF